MEKSRFGCLLHVNNVASQCFETLFRYIDIRRPMIGTLKARNFNNWDFERIVIIMLRPMGMSVPSLHRECAESLIKRVCIFCRLESVITYSVVLPSKAKMVILIKTSL